MRQESKSIVLTSRQSDFTVQLYPPIQTQENGHHEIALVGLDMYHSIPNVTPSNNEFVYEFRNELNRFHIPVGCYEIESLNNYIQKECVKRNHSELFEIKANPNTLKCIIVIKDPDVKIDFNRKNSLRTLLGFGKTTVETMGEHESPDIVKILSVNTILVLCDIIEGSYVNDTQSPVLYTFFPNVPPGYKIVENPQTVVYLPVSYTPIHKIRILLTDQNGERLNIRGEEVTVRLHLRSSYPN